MKSFLCGAYRVLFIEGEEDGIVLIDLYKKDEEAGEVYITSQEVNVLKKEVDGIEAFVLDSGEKEAIMAKMSFHGEPSQKIARELLVKVWEKMGLRPPRELECLEER